MKTKEELSALKIEVEALNKKLAELSEEELAQVSGGVESHNNVVGGSGQITQRVKIIEDHAKIMGRDENDIVGMAHMGEIYEVEQVDNIYYYFYRYGQRRMIYRKSAQLLGNWPGMM